MSKESQPIEPSKVEAHKVNRRIRKEIAGLGIEHTVESDVAETPEPGIDINNPLPWHGELVPLDVPEKLTMQVASRIGARAGKAAGSRIAEEVNGLKWQDASDGTYVKVNEAGEVVDMIFPDEWEH